jgi:hypothetical protein
LLGEGSLRRALRHYEAHYHEERNHQGKDMRPRAHSISAGSPAAPDTAPSSKQEHPIQAMGFWLFGLLSVVLAVLKLTVAGYWSWWRVMLPFLAFLGHSAVYLLAGFLCFCWLKHEEDEEEPGTVQKHSREGTTQRRCWFWPCSGRFEVVVLFGMLSLVAQFVYWSRIVSGLNQEHA